MELYVTECLPPYHLRMKSENKYMYNKNSCGSDILCYAWATIPVVRVALPFYN